MNAQKNMNCLRVTNEMMNMHACYLLLKPTDAEAFPDYYKKIKNPIDLSTIKQKLETFQYKTPEEWYEDMLTMFKNCIQYNARETVIGELATYGLYVFKKKAFELINPSIHEWTYQITKYRNKLDYLMTTAPSSVSRAIKSSTLPKPAIENHDDLAYNLSSLSSKTDICVMTQILAQYGVKVDGSKNETAFVELSSLPAAAIKVLSRYARERGFVD